MKLANVAITAVAAFAIVNFCACSVPNQSAHASNIKSPATDTTEPRLNRATAAKLLEDPRFSQPAGWQWGHFKSADTASIRYGFATPAKPPIGTIVLLPGFTEFSEVYFETAREFLDHGYAVYAMDWRGAGGSDRFLKDPEKASSLGIEHDEDDLDQFLQIVTRKHAKAPLILVAHSLGSHIVLRYLHDHPGVADKAILSAPPFDCPGTKSPPWMVRSYSWLMWHRNKGDDYVDGQGNWQYMAPKVSKMFTHSHDPVRVKLEEAWSEVDPKLQSGGATWKWLFLFQQSCDILTDPTYLAAIQTPVLLGCALSDNIADPAHEQQIARRIPRCQLYEGADARHDLFLEDDKHRAPWMQAIFKFLGTSSAAVRARNRSSRL